MTIYSFFFVVGDNIRDTVTSEQLSWNMKSVNYEVKGKNVLLSVLYWKRSVVFWNHTAKQVLVWNRLTAQVHNIKQSNIALARILIKFDAITFILMHIHWLSIFVEAAFSIKKNHSAFQPFSIIFIYLQIDNNILISFFKHVLVFILEKEN